MELGLAEQELEAHRVAVERYRGLERLHPDDHIADPAVHGGSPTRLREDIVRGGGALSQEWQIVSRMCQSPSPSHGAARRGPLPLPVGEGNAHNSLFPREREGAPKAREGEGRRSLLLRSGGFTFARCTPHPPPTT